MAKIISSPHSHATGIGSLPNIDPLEACQDVLEIFPAFPYIPSLPRRGLLERIVFNDSEQLPGRIIRDERLFFDSSFNSTAAMEQVYMNYVEKNFTPYALHTEYSSAFTEMMMHKLPAVSILKFQITGPVTFGMQVVDEAKRPIYFDAQLADVLGKMLALKARWCEVEMQKKTGVKETLIFLNEPYFASLGSSVVPIDRETVKANWEDAAALVEGGLGIHCCSNTDWEFVISLNPSVVSLDAYTTAEEFLLYADTIITYMERGGVVAWGIVPSDPQLFTTENTDSLYNKYLDIRKKLCNCMQEDLFDAQSLITPSCGIRFADRPMARAIMQAAAEISCRIRAKSA